MKIKLTKEQEIVKLMFKDFLTEYNSRNISPKVGLTHSGAFRALKKLGEKEIVKSRQVGKAVIYSLNFENPLTLKEIETTLTIEALNHRMWIEEFKKLEGKAKSVVLFGSILRNEKEARDIDLHVVADKKEYREIKKIIEERNKILPKPIHLVFQTPDDFKSDVKRKYKVTMEIIKMGIVLFGQDEFRKMVIEK